MIEGRCRRQRNKTPELIKLTALYCVTVFGRWSSHCTFYSPMIPNQFPSPGSDLVSSSIADYLWLLMEAQAPAQPLPVAVTGWSECSDQICFKDMQLWGEGRELSSLPASDQPNTKYSICKSRHIFKVVAVEKLVLAGWDSHRKKKTSDFSFSSFLLERFTSSQQPW